MSKSKRCAKIPSTTPDNKAESPIAPGRAPESGDSLRAAASHDDVELTSKTKSKTSFPDQTQSLSN